MFDKPAHETRGLQPILRLDCTLRFPALPAPIAWIVRLEPLPSLRSIPWSTTGADLMFKHLALAALLSAGVAVASTVSYDPGTPYVVTPAMQDYTTTGPMMAGMQITVVQGGVSSQHTWGVLQDDFGTFNRGGVITDSFAIWADGNTWCFSGCAMWRVWQLGTEPINQVIFHGDSAGVVFDLTTQPYDNFGTPGSARGYTFAIAQSFFVGLEVDAVYRNEVSVGGAPVVGDLFTTLELNFAGNGLFSYMQFGADTDLIPPGALMKPAVPAPVPEPASLALVGAGMALMGLRRRSRHINPGETA